MKLKTDMTPGVVGTALAAVAAGSLVLFSLVLQQSAFDTSSTNGLKALAPGERAGQRILVEAAPEDNDGGQAGGDATVAETSGSEEPSTASPGTESFSPIPDDDLVAETDDPPVGEIPSAGGGTGSTLDDFGIGATARDRGPQATISKDPNGRPGDVELPDRNGPKNTAPPHGSDPDRGNDDSDGRADRDEPQNDRQKSWSKDRAKNDRQKSWSKDRGKNDRQKAWAKSKRAKNDKSRDSSSRDKNKSSRDKNKSSRDKPNNSGKSNDGKGDRDHHSNNGDDREDRESKDRNDRHDSRKDSDDHDDDDGDDDDDDRHDDSHHSNDDSRGHSGSRDPKH